METNVQINCGKCKNQVSPNKLKAKCSECHLEYHLTKVCSGIVAESWKTKSEEGRNSWRCQDCRNVSKSQVSQKINEYESRNASAVKRKKVNESEDDDERGLDLNGNIPMNSNDNLLAAMQNIFRNEFDKHRQDMKSNIDEVKELLTDQQESINELKNDNENLRSKVSTVENQVFDMEQYSRLNNVLIMGLPEKPKENRWDILSNLVEKLDFRLTPADIDDCHRLNVRNTDQGPRPFILRFVNRHMKRAFQIHCRRMKPSAELFGGKKEEAIYVNDHLTAQTIELKNYARDKLTAIGYKVSTENCVVVAWKVREKKIFLRNRSQIETLLCKRIDDTQMMSEHYDVEVKSSSSHKGSK